VSGFWPAEAGSEQDWYYFGDRAWKHTQQEMTWLQMPDENQTRVFLWGETRITSWNVDNATTQQQTTAYYSRYQRYLEAGDRGILVLNPRTGEFWMPARLDNSGNSTHGTGFGTEYVQARQTSSYYEGRSSMEAYYYSTYAYHLWEAHSQGLGAYIESVGNTTTSSNGWNANGMGRVATSVAASADGLWCATTMPGGDAQKILLWRTDGASIDPAFIGNANVTGVNGADRNGDPIANSAAIVDLPGSTSSNANDLLPDSLMFVDGGLVFLRYTDSTTSDYSLDEVFGLNLVTGDVTSRSLSAAVAVNSDQNPGKFTGIVSSRAMYVPDQDQSYLLFSQGSASVQFAWTANKPVPGSTGPTALAFVAGDNEYLQRLPNTTAIDRQGFHQTGNDYKTVMFLELNPDADTNGLDLSSAGTVLTDLSGSDSRIYGDYLTPGRRGEAKEFLKMSDDGKYVAAVRDWARDTNSSTYGRATIGSAFYYNSSSTSFPRTADDLLLFSTPVAHAAGEIDMDEDKSGQQHVLFIGTNTRSTSGAAGSTPSMPNYASARNLVDGATRRIAGLEFSTDNRSLMFDYTGDAWTDSKLTGYFYGWGQNPGHAGTSTSYNNNIGLQLAIRFNFRDPSDGGPIDITDSNAKNLVANMLEGMSGIGNVGDVSPPFTVTRTTTFSSTASRDAEQVWHFKFRSANGDFLYFVSDRISGASHMFGVNMTADDIVSPEGETREPLVAFKAHGTGVSFEQMEWKGWILASRIAASPGGITNGQTGRDGDGIVFIIGSDSASSTSSTNLEIYALNANLGGECVALTSAVTTGSSNAINYLYPSMDGNTIVAQRSDQTNSRSSRTQLTTSNDIIAVTNVHDVLYDGASPEAFIVSEDASHGSSVAFVGDGTPAGAVALVYSWADGTGNTTWDERNLYIGLLAEGAGRSVLDTVESHYAILSGGRKQDDDAASAD